MEYRYGLKKLFAFLILRPAASLIASKRGKSLRGAGLDATGLEEMVGMGAAFAWRGMKPMRKMKTRMLES